MNCEEDREARGRERKTRVAVSGKSSFWSVPNGMELVKGDAFYTL